MINQARIHKFLSYKSCFYNEFNKMFVICVGWEKYEEKELKMIEKLFKVKRASSTLEKEWRKWRKRRNRKVATRNCTVMTRRTHWRARNSKDAWSWCVQIEEIKAARSLCQVGTKGYFWDINCRISWLGQEVFKPSFYLLWDFCIII